MDLLLLILILNFQSSDEMCRWLKRRTQNNVCLNHFLCLLNRRPRYPIRIDTCSSSAPLLRATVNGEHPPSCSSLKLWLLYLFCSSLSAATPEGSAEEGLQLSGNSDWITLHPVRVQVWVSCYWQATAELWSCWREEGSYCCPFFCGAVSEVNVAAVRQNTHNCNSETKKVKWAYTFP